jgi:hypothetical protein
VLYRSISLRDRRLHIPCQTNHFGNFGKAEDSQRGQVHGNGFRNQRRFLAQAQGLIPGACSFHGRKDTSPARVTATPQIIQVLDTENLACILWFSPKSLFPALPRIDGPGVDCPGARTYLYGPLLRDSAL